MVTYNFIEIQGIKIFYRETIVENKPDLVLFHGFPSSSHMFRDLISKLEDEYHIIAPDYPAFGQSDIPGSTPSAQNPIPFLPMDICLTYIIRKDRSMMRYNPT